MNNAILGLIIMALGVATEARAAERPVPSADTPPAAMSAGDVTCDVMLNVDDPDPKGLNVRAEPDAKTGKVIAVLKPVGDWTEVHVVAQRGNWVRIDRAEAIDDSAEDGIRKVFAGDGWVYTSKLGFSELYVGDGTVVRDKPAPDGTELLRVDNPDNEPKSTKVLGCQAGYLKVEVDGKIGWTDQWCTNERTTCS